MIEGYQKSNYPESRAEARVVVASPSPFRYSVLVEEIIALPAVLVPQYRGNDTKAGKALVNAFDARIFVWTGRGLV